MIIIFMFLMAVYDKLELSVKALCKCSYKLQKVIDIVVFGVLPLAYKYAKSNALTIMGTNRWFCMSTQLLKLLRLLVFP